MIVRFRSHHAFASALAALIALALVGTAGQASAQGAAPNAAHHPSQAAVLLAR